MLQLPSGQKLLGYLLIGALPLPLYWYATGNALDNTKGRDAAMDRNGQKLSDKLQRSHSATANYAFAADWG